MSDDTKRPAKGQKMKLNKAKVPTKAATEATIPKSASPKPASTKPEATQSKAQAKATAPKSASPKAQSSKGAERPTSRPQSDRPRRDAGRPTFRGHHQPEAHQSRPRVFFALRVPAEVTTPLSEAQKALRGNWRAVRPEQFHVTLAYLPSIDPARIDDLKRLGTRLAQESAPLDIKLRGTGYFPNEGSPRVWFVKVEGEGLDELAAKLRAETADMGLEAEENFKAHITLARKKGPAPRVAPKIFELGWQAPQLVLYRSHLQKTGPVYEVLSTFKFRGAVSTQPSAISNE